MNEVKSDREFADNEMKEVDVILSKATELKDKIFKESIQLINS